MKVLVRIRGIVSGKNAARYIPGWVWCAGDSTQGKGNEQVAWARMCAYACMKDLMGRQVKENKGIYLLLLSG